jgi:hypothetical protein
MFFPARKAVDACVPGGGEVGMLNLLYERTLGKPTIGQLANNQRREFKFPNEGFFPMTRGRFPSDITKLDSHK